MDAQLTQERSGHFKSLSQAMRANGIFTTVSGFTLLVASKAAAELTGLDDSLLFAGLGFILLLYALFLFVVSARRPVNRRYAYAAVALDAGWVVGSLLILVSGWPPMSVAGRWAVALLAEVVGLFALWQAYALGLLTRKR